MVFGIGIDAVLIERMMDDRIREHAVLRMFHPQEVAQAKELQGRMRAQFLATRFAAKEALGKALGCGMKGLSPCEIQVCKDDNGKPFLMLHGTSKQFVSELIPHGTIHLSLAHEPPLAFAQVLVEVPGGEHASK